MKKLKRGEVLLLERLKETEEELNQTKKGEDKEKNFNYKTISRILFSFCFAILLKGTETIFFSAKNVNAC